MQGLAKQLCSKPEISPSWRSWRPPDSDVGRLEWIASLEMRPIRDMAEDADTLPGAQHGSSNLETSSKGAVFQVIQHINFVELV